MTTLGFQITMLWGKEFWLFKYYSRNFCFYDTILMRNQKCPLKKIGFTLSFWELNKIVTFWRNPGSCMRKNGGFKSAQKVNTGRAVCFIRNLSTAQEFIIISANFLSSLHLAEFEGCQDQAKALAKKFALPLFTAEYFLLRQAGTLCFSEYKNT